MLTIVGSKLLTIITATIAKFRIASYLLLIFFFFFSRGPHTKQKKWSENHLTVELDE